MLVSCRLIMLSLTRYETPTLCKSSLFTSFSRNFSFSSTDPTTTIAQGCTLTTDRCFTLHDVQTFLELTGDHNPIHKSPSSSSSSSPILPGLLIAALFPALVGTHFPGVLYASQTLKFRKTAMVGEPLRATVTAVFVSGKGRVKWNTKCIDSSSRVIVEGEALSILKEKRGDS